MNRSSRSRFVAGRSSSRSAASSSVRFSNASVARVARSGLLLMYAAPRQTPPAQLPKRPEPQRVSNVSQTTSQYSLQSNWPHRDREEVRTIRRPTPGPCRLRHVQQPLASIAHACQRIVRRCGRTAAAHRSRPHPDPRHHGRHAVLGRTFDRVELRLFALRQCFSMNARTTSRRSRRRRSCAVVVLWRSC